MARIQPLRISPEAACEGGFKTFGGMASHVRTSVSPCSSSFWRMAASPFCTRCIGGTISSMILGHLEEKALASV